VSPLASGIAHTRQRADGSFGSDAAQPSQKYVSELVVPQSAQTGASRRRARLAQLSKTRALQFDNEAPVTEHPGLLKSQRSPDEYPFD
jgi:hypothetical protein